LSERRLWADEDGSKQLSIRKLPGSTRGFTDALAKSILFPWHLDSPVNEAVFHHVCEAVVFENVSFQQDSTEILGDLNLTIREGELLVLLGSSGCGKTTSIKMINGLLYPTRGKVLVQTFQP
jgi:ABC-type multidrug transport system fused ATPase/permease subunit